MPATIVRPVAESFVIEGGHTLSGRLRAAGNKNGALPILAACLLTDEPVVLANVPRIRDVETLVELIASAGVDTNWVSRNTLHIHAKTVVSTKLDPALCRKIRASILLAGPLLARCGQIELPPPGGDVIGRRRVDTHFLALERLGATFELSDNFILSTSGLRGADIFLVQTGCIPVDRNLMELMLMIQAAKLASATAIAPLSK